MAPVHDISSRRHIALASGGNIVVGLWLLVAPLVLSYQSRAAVWNDVIVGLIVVTFAAVRVSQKTGTRALSSLNVLLGAWLLVAPYFLGYVTYPARWNDLVAGILILVFALWSRTQRVRSVSPDRR